MISLRAHASTSMEGNGQHLCEVAYTDAGFFDVPPPAAPKSQRVRAGDRGPCRGRGAARRARPPRSCREIALERAESSGVVSAARRQGVNKTRKIRWLAADGAIRPGRAALPVRVRSLIP